MTVIENRKPTIRRRECSGAPTWQWRRTPATDERPTTGERSTATARTGRSARSEARARNAVIDAYARDAASTRTPGAAEMRFEL